METINDIRREEGNPNAGQPNSGPLPVNRAFHNPGAGMRLTATIVLIIGAILTVLGIVTFIIPITIVGGCVMLVGGFLFMRARSNVLNA
jgi:Flp pilus assembly protein TadB